MDALCRQRLDGRRLFPAYEQQVLDHVRGDPAWQEALRRYRAHREMLKTRRLERKADAAAPRPRYCMLCMEPAAPDRLMFGNEECVVCEHCVAQATAAFAEARATPNRRRDSPVNC